MERLSSMLSPGREFTVEDLESTPHDGRRYELVSGSLIVTPVPHGRHQRALAAVFRVLDSVVPSGLEVLFAPYEWHVDHDTVVQPDLLVCRPEDVGARLLSPPVLVVEVLSPSTRRFDLLVKRDVYDEGGVEAYWIVDPEGRSVTVLGRRRPGDRLEVVAEAAGDEELLVEQPFVVRLHPSGLFS